MISVFAIVVFINLSCCPASLVGSLHTADCVHHLNDVHLVDLHLPKGAAEYLPQTFAEVLGDKRVDDGV